MSNDTSSTFIEISRHKDITILRFTRRTILDPVSIEEVGTLLLQLVEPKQSPKMIINFSRVESVTSAMLGKLVALEQNTLKAGGKLAFCSIDPFLLQIFTLCQFPTSTPLCADEAEAIATLTDSREE